MAVPGDLDLGSIPGDDGLWKVLFRPSRVQLQPNPNTPKISEFQRKELTNCGYQTRVLCPEKVGGDWTVILRQLGMVGHSCNPGFQAFQASLGSIAEPCASKVRLCLEGVHVSSGSAHHSQKSPHFLCPCSPSLWCPTWETAAPSSPSVLSVTSGTQ